jgi:two-component system, OmpR family, sensor histidine kinase MprB
MSFRRRTVLLAAGAVAAAIVIASVVVYFVTRNELVGQIDSSLRQKPQSVMFADAEAKTELAKLEREGAVASAATQLAKLAREGKLPPGASAQSAQVSVRVHLGTAVVGEASTPVPGHASGSAGTVSAKPAPTGGSSSGGEQSSGGPAPAGAGRGEPSVSLEHNTLVAPNGSTAKVLPGPGSQAQLALPAAALGGATGYVQLYTIAGRLLHSGSKPGLLLPVTATTRAVADGKHGAFFSDVTVRGTPVRMFTEQAGKGAVWQAALPLSELDSTLSHLRLVLGLVCLGGVLLAVTLGLLVSRAALVPVRRLIGAVEQVARTQDLGHRVRAGNDDDLGRLAGSFNTMLAALERSRLAQRQLVSDASHELRTPLTSVQANLDALALGERLAPFERARIVAAVQAQLSELTVLVGDLVDLSKTDVEEVEVEDVRLDLAVAAALRRAQLHASRCGFMLDGEPCLVRCAPGRLDRAIANLLDNACQWTASPQAGPIEVRVRDGTLQVRDHGPGIAVEDLPRVFDRFYRSPAARARPGSGLGLAIVRHFAETHGGSVHAANAPGGGALLTLELPDVPMTEAELQAAGPDGALHQAPPIL